MISVGRSHRTMNHRITIGYDPRHVFPGLKIALDHLDR